MEWHQRLSRALRTATEASREAGTLIMQELAHLKPQDIQEKGPSDFVTRVDKASERLILDRIRKEFPDDKILSEEAGGTQPSEDAEDLWVVDPLDGTSNFIHRFPLFCVSIAYCQRGRPVVGAIFDPIHQEMFTCKRDEGLWLNGAPIGVSAVADPGQAYIATGFPARFKKDAEPYFRQFRAVFEAVAGLRRGGSAALDLAYVACGRFDGFWEPRLAPWDMAAGMLMVEAAGGIVSDQAGGPWSLDAKGIIAGNPDMHPKLVALLDVEARLSA
jgi:myo-inositol-1(or 4)-monophosphatase